MELAKNRRGTFLSMEYLDPQRVLLNFELPLGEVIVDFYDQLKTRTQGYASMDFEEIGYRAANLVKVDVLVAGEPVDALSVIVHRDRAQAIGRELVHRLRGLIPRQMFEIAVQAAIGSNVIARETVAAMRKNVLAKCYGGDITRKRKLLEKQKEGKQRMKRVGIRRNTAGGLPGGSPNGRGMSAETIRVLIAAGFFMLLLFLRLEAERFGAAEYDEPGRTTGRLDRLSWYAIGLALLAAIYLVHPPPHDVLFLLVGHRSEALAVRRWPGRCSGIAQAAAVRLVPVRLPAAAGRAGPIRERRSTPSARPSSTRRPSAERSWARWSRSVCRTAGPILMAALVYVLATRLAAPGRHPTCCCWRSAWAWPCGWATARDRRHRGGDHRPRR